MEPLTEDDLDYLTRVENKLLSMRKRETQHHPKGLLPSDLTMAINKVHTVRQMLQARFEKTVDDDL